MSQKYCAYVMLLDYFFFNFGGKFFLILFYRKTELHSNLINFFQNYSEKFNIKNVCFRRHLCLLLLILFYLIKKQAAEK